jgi:hypothetical protein
VIADGGRETREASGVDGVQVLRLDAACWWRSERDVVGELGRGGTEMETFK